MKVPVDRTVKKARGGLTRKSRVYSNVIYRAQKEGIRTQSLVLTGGSGCPRRVMLRLVGSEAARLARLNGPGKRSVITYQEIQTASVLLYRRTRARQTGA